MDSLIKKNKEKKKRPEPKKNNPKQKEEISKVVPTPPKKEKVWKQTEGAPKSTTTPPKSNKMVWRLKKVQPTSPGTDVPSSSKNLRRKVMLIGLTTGEPLPKVNW